MSMLRGAFIIFCMVFTSVSGVDFKPWAVFYGEDAPMERFKPFYLLVFDSDAHPALQKFTGQDKLFLGYLSLGEVEQGRAHFPAVQKEGLFLGENPVWKESQYVDLRDPRWAKRVIEELIPAILFQRFDGLFLDTLDNAGYLEDTDPEKFRGMRAAAIHLVKAIRLHYPQIKIMMNRGFDLMPELASQVDMLLGESLYTTYDFARKRYERVPADQYAQQVVQMQRAKTANPQLTLYALDYWDPADTATIKEIYRAEREHGLNPYVSTPELTSIYTP
jgi:uncharacterized protein (TIGR01370 family)